MDDLSASRRLLPVLAVAVAAASLLVAVIAGADPSDADSRPVDPRFVRLVAAHVAPDEVVIDAIVVVPGDGAYRIENPDPTADSLPVADDVVVTSVDCRGNGGCEEGVASDYATLTRSVAGASMYAELVVEDGRVVRIDERYLA